MESQLILGDCIEKLKEFSENSVDLVVSDPPYGIGVSNVKADWDKYLPPKEAFEEMYRVLKPGALAFVMSSPRQDGLWRMLKLLEEARFEIRRNFIVWIHNNGFPRAFDISKAMDEKLGIKRPIIRYKNMPPDSTIFSGGLTGAIISNKPISEEAKKLKGLKSLGGLKPAHECILMVNKPLEGSTLENVLEWGTGAINTDLTKLGEGAYPANVLASDGMLDSYNRFFNLDAWAEHNGFLTCSKPSTREREAGLSNIVDYSKGGKQENIHPTVKPIKLMAYLIELGCPPEGIVLDPFMGTGTTCIAAKMLGRKYIGIEIEEKYFKIAQKRVENVLSSSKESTLDKF